MYQIGVFQTKKVSNQRYQIKKYQNKNKQIKNTSNQECTIQEVSNKNIPRIHQIKDISNKEALFNPEIQN